MPDKLKEIQDIFTYGKCNYRPTFQQSSSYATQIVVVGCGGTGSRLIPLIAQHISNHNVEVTRPNNKQYLKGKMELILVDMDWVEFKNLKRQNFFAFDVGKNKASCLAERFSALYGIDIEVYTDIFENCRSSISSQSKGNTIIFDCTDNKLARESIEKFNQYATIISCGNEDTFGQIFVGTVWAGGKKTYQLMKSLKSIRQLITNPLAMCRKDADGSLWNDISYLPTFLQTFKAFKDTEAPSCTDIDLPDEQSMPINALVAQLAYNAFYTLISGQGLSYNLVKCSVDNQYHTEFISNPVKLRALMHKSIFGIQDEESEEAYKDTIVKIERAYNLKYTDLESYIESYGLYSLPLLKICSEHSYMISGDQAVLLNTKIEELEEQLKLKLLGA